MMADLLFQQSAEANLPNYSFLLGKKGIKTFAMI